MCSTACSAAQTSRIIELQIRIGCTELDGTEENFLKAASHFASS